MPIPGLSPHGVAVLVRFEHVRMWPGATAEALRLWAEFLGDPYHRLYDPKYEGCGYWGCCTDPWEVRTYLEAVAHALPRRDARRFRSELSDLDERW